MAKGSSNSRPKALGLWLLGLAGLASSAGMVWTSFEIQTANPISSLSVTGLDLIPTISAIALLQLCMIAVIWFLPRVPRLLLSAAALASTLYLGVLILSDRFSVFTGNPAVIKAVAKLTGIGDAESQSGLFVSSSLADLPRAFALAALALTAATQIWCVLAKASWRQSARKYERAATKTARQAEDNADQKHDSASLWDAQG